MKAKVKYYPNGDIIPEAKSTDKKSQPQSTKNADKKKEK